MSSRMDLAAVLRAAQSTDPAGVVDLLAGAAREIGATDLTVYLVDFEQLVLEPLPDRSAHADLAHTEEVAATMAGRAFVTREPVTVERRDGTRIWVPIIEGSDRTGVLAMTIPQIDDHTITECEGLGLLAGYLIAAHTRCTDLYQLHRRRKSMSLAASMQWDLLPPLVMHTPRCSVAARLEPAYEVGGDCFDYSLNGALLDVALIDAMGHGITSASIASMVVGTYRHGRREGRSLVAMHATLNDVLMEQFSGDAFATGQLAQLELDGGLLTWTNAGHPSPLLVRNGQVIKELEGDKTFPWGLEAGEAPQLHESLEHGDSVVFFTDGVVEARTPDGEEFGLDRLADIVGQSASEQLPPEEIVRHLVRSVLDHRRSRLRDDATVLLVQWNGPAT